MFTSVTLRPVRFSIRFITLLRTASVVCGICLPYSMAIERSAAASSAPTSTETPRVWLPPPTPDMGLGTLSKSPPIARAVHHRFALLLPLGPRCQRSWPQPHPLWWLRLARSEVGFPAGAPAWSFVRPRSLLSQKKAYDQVLCR